MMNDPVLDMQPISVQHTHQSLNAIGCLAMLHLVICQKYQYYLLFTNLDLSDAPVYRFAVKLFIDLRMTTGKSEL